MFSFDSVKIYYEEFLHQILAFCQEKKFSNTKIINTKEILPAGT